MWNRPRTEVFLLKSKNQSFCDLLNLNLSQNPVTETGRRVRDLGKGPQELSTRPVGDERVGYCPTREGDYG